MTSPFAGQIARSQAPSRTHMAMPAHLAEMAMRLPTRRNAITPKPSFVDMDQLDQKRIAMERSERDAIDRFRAKIEDQRERADRQIRKRAEIEARRRKALGLTGSYLQHPSRAARLLKIACEYLGTTDKHMKKHCRLRTLVHVRQIACWLLRNNVKTVYGEQIGWKALGRIFNRDHATIMHSVAMVEKNQELKEKAIEIEIQMLKRERALYGDMNHA